MSIMPPIKSHPSRSRHSVHGLHGLQTAAATVTLSKALRLMNDWPDVWQIDDADLRYGQDLLEELKPFITHLVGVEKLSRSSVRRHLDHLFLLGGELISRINTHTADRRLSGGRLLDNSLCAEGGPPCRHVQPAGQQRYDATCKKLYAFRSEC